MATAFQCLTPVLLDDAAIDDIAEHYRFVRTDDATAQHVVRLLAHIKALAVAGAASLPRTPTRHASQQATSTTSTSAGTKPMRPGERQVWACAFERGIDNGHEPKFAAVNARKAVDRMNAAAGENLDEATRSMLYDILYYDVRAPSASGDSPGPNFPAQLDVLRHDPRIDALETDTRDVRERFFALERRVQEIDGKERLTKVGVTLGGNAASPTVSARLDTIERKCPTYEGSIVACEKRLATIEDDLRSVVLGRQELPVDDRVASLTRDLNALTRRLDELDKRLRGGA
jgi:tetrahydromethanopterin S-methyltransferase subunit G